MARSESLSSTRRTGNDAIEGTRPVSCPSIVSSSPNLPPRDHPDNPTLAVRDHLNPAVSRVRGKPGRPQEHNVMPGRIDVAVICQRVRVGLERVMANPRGEVN